MTTRPVFTPADGPALHIPREPEPPAFEVICEDTTAITREEWLELRRTGIGGSDIAAVMGQSPFTSRYALWVDKVEGVSATAESEYMKWGNRLEDSIAKAFEEEAGEPIVYRPQMLRSTRSSFALANPDRFLADGGIVEVKNVGLHRKDEWESDVPLHYRLQGQWYLFVTGEKVVYFAVLIGGQNFVIYRVHRDDALIAQMVREAEAFWSLVTLKRPPEIDGEGSTTEALRAQYSTVERPSVELGDPFLGLLEARAAAKAVVDAAEEQLAVIDNKIVAQMGDAEVALVGGTPRATRRSYERTTIDTTALKRDYPAIVGDYSKVTPYRRLVIPKAKEG